jgi:hypothetical protein
MFTFTILLFYIVIFHSQPKKEIPAVDQLPKGPGMITVAFEKTQKFIFGAITLLILKPLALLLCFIVGLFL